MSCEIEKIVKKTVYYVYLLFPLLTMIFGTIGNLWSFFIFMDKGFRKKSIGFYSACAAIIGILIQYIGSLKFFLEVVYENPQNISLFWCKFMSYTIRPLHGIAAWIQVAVTLDRYLTIKHRNRFGFIEKRWFQLLVVKTISIAYFLYQIPVAVSYGYYEISNSTNISKLVCLTKSMPIFILNDVGLILLNCLIPFTLMIFLTISLIIFIIHSRKKLKLTTFKERAKREYHFAFATVTQNIVFFLMTLPICSLWPAVSLKIVGLLDETHVQALVMELSKALFHALFYTYFASSFLINYLSNSLFRKTAFKFNCRF